MQYFNKLKATGMLLCMALFALTSQTALAAGTASGTNISNTATVDYQVGGVSQTQITSTTASFVVDNRVDVTVAEVATTYVDVVPGATAQVMSFTVTNTGNTSQDFAVSAAANGTDPFGGTDNFDATGVSVFVDANSNGTYESGTDTGVHINALAADASITVFVVANIPVAQVNGDIAAYTLTAEARTDDGAGTLGGALTETAGADTPGSVDIVFGDGTGDTDGARDASHSDTGAYRVVTASLTVTKTVATISDPFNGTTNPKAIPGATMRYTITVQNTSATTAATSVLIVDTPPANTTYTAATITLDTVAQTDASDSPTDESEFSGGAVRVSIPSLAASTSATITFDVTID